MGTSKSGEQASLVKGCMLALPCWIWSEREYVCAHQGSLVQGGFWRGWLEEGELEAGRGCFWAGWGGTLVDWAQEGLGLAAALPNSFPACLVLHRTAWICARNFAGTRSE